MTKQASGHILMTADTVGGVWNYALELTRGLAEHGVRVSLATMGRHLSAEQERDAHALPNLQVFQSDYKLEWMQDPWADVQIAGDWLLDLEQRLCPDIVHLNNYIHGSLPWRAPAILVAHSCVLSWWRAVLGEDCDTEWATYRNKVARGLRAVQAIIAPSRGMLKALYDHYSPIPAGRVIPNGRSSKLFSPGIKEAYILTAGRLWDKAKNVKVLESIAGNIPWPIRVAGEPQQPGTRQTARFNGLHLLGRLSPEKLRAQYRKASIYVAPARYEPFGLSILEAALSGCPLVLGDIPTLREMWDGAAIFVDSGNPRNLEIALRELIRSPWLRRSLSLRGRKRALQYSAERMTSGYMETYQALLESRIRSQKVVQFAMPRSV